MAKNPFKLSTHMTPAGDQPKAIAALVKGLEKGMKKQTLLGVTGSGKTFTMANVIAGIGKPTLVIAHNKTLAAQLAQEYKEFFPDAAVHYFVSYYDYYQPEAYLPVTDTYIEKDAQINKEIDRLRHASTQALLTRRDVIIVASVSCIYGLGSPEEYREENIAIEVGKKISRTDFMKKLVSLHFERTTADLSPAQFRALGNKIEIMPVSETFVWHIEFAGDTISKILKINPVSSVIIEEPKDIFIFPAKHFLTDKKKIDKAIKAIKDELAAQLKKFEAEGKLLEAERIKRRTSYDLAMIKEVGYCSGIENYSKHLSGKKEGEPPETLLSYFPSTTLGTGPNAKKIPDFLTIIDESHVTISQLRGMFAGDASRKNTLVEHGFRLPSAKDNRPLRYDEFEARVGQVIYTTATPTEYEKEESRKSTAELRQRGIEVPTEEGIVEQIVRPTGLVDPELAVRPIVPQGNYKGQVGDFIDETLKEVKKGGRVLATTLTKKMAEDLSVYLKEKGIKAEYLHSEITTLDRIKILSSFRRGDFDCLVGVNLLREGLDMPEVSFIGVLDADKEGFLRSDTSLIQTIGRAARNVDGRVILYADNVTGSMERAMGETHRRRAVQIAYNKEHGITPKTIIKKIKDITEEMEKEHDKAVAYNLELDVALFGKNLKALDKKEEKKLVRLSDEEREQAVYDKIIKIKEKEMNKAVKELDFETAAILRDEIKAIAEKLGKGK